MSKNSPITKYQRIRVLRLVVERRQPDPITLPELREATGYSRRELNRVMRELKKDQKISRTRTGFISTAEARVAAGRRAGTIEHEDECLCRLCLTPRYELARRRKSPTED